jgi:uncharacterized membrane protein YtjA (UPF0391 family)
MTWLLSYGGQTRPQGPSSIGCAEVSCPAGGERALARPLLVRVCTREKLALRASLEVVMLYWAAVFFIIALVAAVFGFGGIAAGAAGVAKVLFFVFLVLAALSLIFRGRSTPIT